MLSVRAARHVDAEAVARIYNEGIEERSSTFETALRTVEDVLGWLAAGELGYWKLTGKLFPENAASLALVRRCGWREVGLHLRHGRLDGAWRDVLVVERPIGAQAPAPDGGAASPGA
jgi:L-amino acid N-acyltransferase YncA